MKTSKHPGSRVRSLGSLFLLVSVLGAFADPRPRFAITDLGTLPGGGNTRASRINNLSRVVGQTDDSNGVTRVFIYSAGVLSELNVGPHGGIGIDINDHGAVVGVSGEGLLFLYQDGTTMNLNAITGRQLWAV